MENGELQKLVEEKVKSAIQVNNGELLGSIGAMISQISAPTSSSNIFEAPKFKRKSNEEQFKQNYKVLTKLQEAKDSLEKRNDSAAKQAIIEAESLVSKRQKLIQLADASEQGWRTVAEYETNPIASDSEDEKRIYKAEARANRKAKADRTKRRGMRAPYQKQRPARSEATQPSATSVQKPGLCFLCGKAGHWKNECLQRDRGFQSNNKISTNDILYDSNKSCAEKFFAQEAEQKTHVQPEGESPVGRLKQSIGKWKEITNSKYILDIIQNGYRLPFKSEPAEARLKNNKTARDEPDFVQNEIGSLLKKGVVSEVDYVPRVVNPLTVAYSKSGKKRLVLDCRHINPHLHLFKVKFEDINVALEMFDLSSYTFTFDLKSAYHHIDILPEHRTYLGFSVKSSKENEGDRFFVFNSLPFGLSSAGHIFTKTLRCVVKHWREQGHKVIMYLDDGIGGNKGQKDAEKSSKYVQETLSQLGFLLAQDKCNWLPVRISVWLGYMLDFDRNRLFVVNDRITKLNLTMDYLFSLMQKDKCSWVPVRLLASVTGQIISLQTVLGKIVCRKTRYLHKCIETRKSWKGVVLVDSEAEGELLFWKYGVVGMNKQGRELRSFVKTDMCMFSDASSTGYGGWLAPNVESGGYVQLWDVNKGQRNLMNVSGAYETAPNSQCWLQTGKYLEMYGNDIDLFGPLGNEWLDMQESGRRKDSTFPEANVTEVPEATNSVLPEESRLEISELPEASSGGSMLMLSRDNAEQRSTPQSSGMESIIDTEISGTWSESEAIRSSTWRELEAIHRLLKTHGKKLSKQTVKICTDNRNIRFILQSGSNIEELHRLCLEVHKFCKSKDIKFYVEWIPRSNNVLADSLSRMYDNDDWEITDREFNILDKAWGKHTVDRFACNYNNKCSRFNSKWWVPGTEGIDCFNQSWSGEMNWFVPPPAQVIACVRKMESDKCIGTLVVPEWKSASFWPLLIAEEGSYRHFVKSVYVMPLTGTIKAGKGNNGVGLKATLKRKFQEAGVSISDSDDVVTHMASNLLASRAVGTVTKYAQQAATFKDFCSSKGFEHLPAEPIHVAMYLSSLIDSGKSVSVINSAFYGVKWLHNIHDLTDPTENTLVKNMLESAKRLNSKPIVKKDVISSELLIELCDMFADTEDVITLRDLSMIVLSYAGFFRFSEVSNLRCCDVKFNSDHLSILIRGSKTDQYRAGNSPVISKGVTSACPYKVLRKYMICAGLDISSDKFLFQPACRSGRKCFLLDKDKKLSYTRARECMLQKLRLVAPNLKLGTHTLRASGVTKAANSEGVSDRCLKRHGRWRSDTAKDGYVEDSLEKRLFITKQLNL